MFTMNCSDVQAYKRAAVFDNASTEPAAAADDDDDDDDDEEEEEGEYGDDGDDDDDNDAFYISFHNEKYQNDVPVWYYADSRLDDGLGGCFNTGPGVLYKPDVYDNRITLNTDFMLPDQSYIIESIVRKNGITARAKIQLDVESRNFNTIDGRLV